MNTVINSGLQGLYRSSQSINSSAQAIASANTRSVSGDALSVDAVINSQNINAPPQLSPYSNVTTGAVNSASSVESSQNIAENLVNLQRQAQIFTASARVLKVGSEALGSLIDDYR
ncbi:MAG: hypothetical protein U5M23_14495 [Marinagarivorans sp.]|nr:hypothetical protein [Marinagarivorans sp.]